MGIDGAYLDLISSIKMLPTVFWFCLLSFRVDCVDCVFATAILVIVIVRKLLFGGMEVKV